MQKIAKAILISGVILLISLIIKFFGYCIYIAFISDISLGLLVLSIILLGIGGILFFISDTPTRKEK